MKKIELLLLHVIICNNKMKTETVFFENIDNEITYYIGKNAKDNFCVIDDAGQMVNEAFKAAK